MTEEQRKRKKEYDRLRYQSNRRPIIDRVLRWRLNNPEKYKANRILQNSSPRCRFRLYGITDEQYDQMLLDQDGRCEICHADDCSLHVDHCHSKGTVRSLLCPQCNTGMGLFKHKPYLLRRAADYL